MAEAPQAAVVHLPRSLVAMFPGAERQAEARGMTVLEVISDLDCRVPGLANRVLDAGPVIRTHLNVFVNGERATVTTPVPPGAEVHVIPAISGG
ncbi:MAG: sulfur-carrier protein [Chloroflexota bacterium]|nr:sulfur-carrier protein [Chloroflexota bacterium]